MREVRLNDINGKSAGNIDYVLVSYDRDGNAVDFGSLEIQGVYISGNITRPFKHYMENRSKRADMDWSKQPHYPRPDYLSSSRKRLAPQLIYKGGILKSWNKKQAVALQKNFFKTIPDLPPATNPKDADMAWFIYDLIFSKGSNQYELVLSDVVFTFFKPALDEILTPQPGKLNNFMGELQSKLDQELSSSPDVPIFTDITSK